MIALLAALAFADDVVLPDVPVASPLAMGQALAMGVRYERTWGDAPADAFWLYGNNGFTGGATALGNPFGMIGGFRLGFVKDPEDNFPLAVGWSAAAAARVASWNWPFLGAVYGHVGGDLEIGNRPWWSRSMRLGLQGGVRVVTLFGRSLRVELDWTEVPGVAHRNPEGQELQVRERRLTASTAWKSLGVGVRYDEEVVRERVGDEAWRSRTLGVFLEGRGKGWAGDFD